MSKLRRSFNSRRNARKQMRKPNKVHSNKVISMNQASTEKKCEEPQTIFQPESTNVSDLNQHPLNFVDNSSNENEDSLNQQNQQDNAEFKVTFEKPESKQDKSELVNNRHNVKKALSKPDSTIIIIYQDENHQSLSSPQIISGKRGETINVKFKEFNHFDLIHIEGFTSVFVEPYGSMTLTYRRQSGANIWLFSKDIDDSHMLGKPRFVSGKVDEKYALTPPNFLGYNLLRAQGPVNGNFNDKQQVVTYYYRDATWKEVDFDVKYLKMKISQPGFDAPRGNDTFITLAKDTVWQVFETVQLVSGERWHCLGGNLWVEEDYDKVRFVDSLPQYQLDNNSEKQFTIDLNFQAIIDFVPGKKLTLYDRPFGNPVDSIKDGSIVTITEREGGRDMQWFKIDDRGWTIRQYLDFDIEHKVSQEKDQLA